jgi:hypothetical protein
MDMIYSHATQNALVEVLTLEFESTGGRQVRSRDLQRYYKIEPDASSE